MPVGRRRGLRAERTPDPALAQPKPGAPDASGNPVALARRPSGPRGQREKVIWSLARGSQLPASQALGIQSEARVSSAQCAIPPWRGLMQLSPFKRRNCQGKKRVGATAFNHLFSLRLKAARQEAASKSVSLSRDQAAGSRALELRNGTTSSKNSVCHAPAQIAAGIRTDVVERCVAPAKMTRPRRSACWSLQCLSGA